MTYVSADIYYAVKNVLKYEARYIHILLLYIHVMQHFTQVSVVIRKIAILEITLFRTEILHAM